MKNIKKNTFLKTLVCSTLGWILHSPKSEELPKESLADKFRKIQGIEIGIRARECFPEGTLIKTLLR